MARPTLVSETTKNNSRQSYISSKGRKNTSLHGSQTRTPEEQTLEDCCLEGVWGSALSELNWPQRAINQFPISLAQSTRYTYNRLLLRCKTFCENRQIVFPPRETGLLAEFLCNTSDESNRPSSVLHSTVAALGHVYMALNIEDITRDNNIRRLITALIKSGTALPRKRSIVMPTQVFSSLFLSWGQNDQLSIKFLRLKAITLLALAFMLRPSDVAPNATFYNQHSETEQKLSFTTDMVTFLPGDNGIKLSLFGIKNDTQREGFEVTVPKHNNDLLDPGITLKEYIDLTSSKRSDKSVFIALNRPYKGISSSAIGKILEEAISLAGLKDQGFSAKSFRPTGATFAIEQGVDPKIVQKIGRWKSTEVFYDHYVHSKTPDDFTNKVIRD